MTAELGRALLTCRLFRKIPPARLDDLLQEFRIVYEQHQAGTIVLHQGHRYQSLVIVVQGHLEARIDESDGRGMTVESFHAVSPIATAVLICSDPVLPVNLVALEDSATVSIPVDAMFSLFHREPDILRAYMEDAGDKVRYLAEKVRLFRFDTLRRRIAGHLLTLAREQSTDSPRWRYGRERTAELLGAARPSLSRELSAMVKDGLIHRVGRKDVYFDRAALSAVLDDD